VPIPNSWRHGCPHIFQRWPEQSYRAGVSAQAEGPVSRIEDHQRRAAECLRLASKATDKTNKALLIEMAKTWAKLAEKERSRMSKADSK
jgi:hypothetical protein